MWGLLLVSATLACGTASEKFPVAGQFAGTLPYLSGTHPSCSATGESAVTCCPPSFSALVEVTTSEGTFLANHQPATKANGSLAWTEVTQAAGEGATPDGRYIGCNIQTTISGVLSRGGSLTLSVANVEDCQTQGDPNSSITTSICHYSGTIE